MVRFEIPNNTIVNKTRVFPTEIGWLIQIANVQPLRGLLHDLFLIENNTNMRSLGKYNEVVVLDSHLPSILSKVICIQLWEFNIDDFGSSQIVELFLSREGTVCEHIEQACEAYQENDCIGMIVDPNKDTNYGISIPDRLLSSFLNLERQTLLLANKEGKTAMLCPSEDEMINFGFGKDTMLVVTTNELIILDRPI